MSDSLLALETLTAGYDEAAVIRDIELTVRPGEVVALLGANGAGKTTTLRAVSGLVKPMSGRVVLDGEVVGIVTDRDLRDAFPSVLDVLRRRPARPSSTDPARIPVEDVMSRNVVSLAPGARVVDAALLMRRERIGAIPVLQRGRLVGILTRSDVLDAFAELAGAADATS